MTAGPGSKQERDDSYKFFHAESASMATNDAACAYQAPALMAAGANAQDVAILSALTNLPIALMYRFLPVITRKLRSRKRAILVLTLLDAWTWLPLILALLLLRPLVPYVLTVLWVANLLPGVLVAPVRDGWIADSVPTGIMGRHLGIRGAVSAVTYLGAFFLMAFVLDALADQAFAGFAVVAGIAFGAALARTVVYVKIRDRVARYHPEYKVSDFLQETKKAQLRRFTVFVSLSNFSLYLASPLFAVYMVNYLGYSYLTFAAVIAADFAGKAMGSPIWGRYSDREGNMPVLRIVTYLIPLMPVLWLVSPNPVYLACVQFVSGMAWAGFDVSRQSFTYRGACPEKRTGYIIYQQALVTFSRALGALLSAVLVGLMMPVLGQRILGMFLVSGILLFAVARIMLPHIRDLVSTEDSPAAAPKPPAMERMKKAAEAGYGIYSTPAAWAYIYKALTGHTRSQPVSEQTANRGLYCRPQDWDVVVRRYVNETPLPVEYLDALTARRGLYHQGEGPQKPKKDAVHEHVPSAFVEAIVSKKGLYYRPEEWRRYLKRVQETPQPRAPGYRTSQPGFSSGRVTFG